MKRLNLARKMDGKRHIIREIRCMWLGWHEESAFCTSYRWCWYCGRDCERLGVNAKPQPPRSIEVREEPCPYCAVWIGPHRHWLREDGSLGAVVDEIPDHERPSNA